MIICSIAIIRKDNMPIWLRVYETLEGEDPLKFHYVAHTALDIIEEKVANRKNASNSGDMYLGLLFPIEIYKVYGYITNSKTKIVVVTDESDVRDADIKTIMQRLHTMLVDTVTNPFYEPYQPLKSRTFDDRVATLVHSYAAAASPIART